MHCISTGFAILGITAVSSYRHMKRWVMGQTHRGERMFGSALLQNSCMSFAGQLRKSLQTTLGKSSNVTHLLWLFR